MSRESPSRTTMRSTDTDSASAAMRYAGTTQPRSRSRSEMSNTLKGTSSLRRKHTNGRSVPPATSVTPGSRPTSVPSQRAVSAKLVMMSV